jgi:CMP-N-acetylneuraminic acid synthetase
MWRHAWQASEDHCARQFEVSLLLEPTSPLRVATDLIATVDAVLDGGRSGAVTVSPTPAHCPPHKTLTVDSDSRVRFLHHQGARFARRQEVPELFHRNGLCYALAPDSFLGGAPLLDDDCAAIVVNRQVVNIDDPFELELADWLLKRQQAGSPDNPTNSWQPAPIGKAYASAPGRWVSIEGNKAS